jgi:glycosyltransferase involved in cell wall biosynthesis
VRIDREPCFAHEGSFVIGAVGRMAEIKDSLTLVRAFQALHRAIGVERRRRLRLVMAGDGPLHEDVNRALAGTPACDLTWLPGRRDDFAEILRGLDLFVLSSRNEGISNTILEAMATGFPVLATNVGGNPELVVAGRTGTLVPGQEPSRWPRRTAQPDGSACFRNTASTLC